MTTCFMGFFRPASGVFTISLPARAGLQFIYATQFESYKLPQYDLPPQYCERPYLHGPLFFFCSCECSSQTDSARRQQAGTDAPAGHFKKESGAVLMCGMRAASTEGHGFAKPIASPALKGPQCGACPSIEARATCKTFRAKRDVPQRHAVSLGHVYAEPRPPPPRRSGARLKKVPVPFLRF